MDSDTYSLEITLWIVTFSQVGSVLYDVLTTLGISDELWLESVELPPGPTAIFHSVLCCCAAVPFGS